jgi:hypothetical protein
LPPPWRWCHADTQAATGRSDGNAAKRCGT